ncbi:hypothetical protein VP01_925g1 [Puccinia sorghi]|uniref:Uncharacterized protein n=1 Tax=Puccinia sorghi TaxID=27349 RepID=A0A0L6U763_9BASI|nr:hypothetical protein VP01_925g1 [Puccinia sorghi]
MICKYWIFFVQTRSWPRQYPIQAGSDTQSLHSSIGPSSKSLLHAPSQNSNSSSDFYSGVLRPETLECIQENVKAIQNSIDKPEELIKCFLFFFKNHRCCTDAEGTTGDHFQAKKINGYSCTPFKRHTSELLITPCNPLSKLTYARSHSSQTWMSPYSLLKASWQILPYATSSLLDAAFHNQHLGPNYCEDTKVMTQLNNLIRNELKANKNKLATIIKALAITDPPTPVPRLGMLVANVYSMLHLVFRDVPLEWARNVGANTPMFWTQIDDNLQRRMYHTSTYQSAFSKLILQKHQALLDGVELI